MALGKACLYLPRTSPPLLSVTANKFCIVVRQASMQTRSACRLTAVKRQCSPSDACRLAPSAAAPSSCAPGGLWDQFKAWGCYNITPWGVCKLP